MSAKDIARLMRAKGVRPRRRERKERTTPPVRPSRRLVDTFQEVPPGAANDPQSVYRIPDAWEAPKSLQKNPLPPTESRPESRATPGPKKKAEHKRRRQAISVCVSAEEEFYLRKFASDQGMSFSEWARVVLFRAMRREIPSRE